LPYTICPYCGRRSYSAATLKEWICPYCEEKVTEKEEREEEKKGDTDKTPGEQA
jgi:tRNA(Ile2) C34 agmatinyltransferase TiaS